MLQSSSAQVMSSRRPTSGRPAVAKRSSIPDSKTNGSAHREDDHMYECKAAYLCIMDDLSDDITSKNQLYEGVGPNYTSQI